MHAPIEHEQAYTPPPDTTDTADAQTSASRPPANQPQPATTGAR
ncbi:hypothetical protein [Actinomyces sp. Z16]|nr:hypothetical protein [Actinomyces sp. Z16]